MPNPPGKYRVGKSDEVGVAEKRRRALELRKAGADYEAIARQVGYASGSGAFKAIQAALKDVVREPAEEVRTIELERLDRIMLGLWKQATSGDARAVDRVLKIMERRAKLLGLDAPVKLDDADLNPLTAKAALLALSRSIPIPDAETEPDAARDA